MPSKLRSRLTYANVMASIAVFVALGGTSYGLASGSIDSREIKNNTVRSKDIRNNDIRGKDVRNGSLLAGDFKPGQLPNGPTGAQGPRGLTGAQGEPGVVDFYINGSGPGGGQVFCDSGDVAVGGGAVGSQPVVNSSPLPHDVDATPVGWEAQEENPGGVTPNPATAWVVCAVPGG
jgi:hypothetical protein